MAKLQIRQRENKNINNNKNEETKYLFHFKSIESRGYKQIKYNNTKPIHFLRTAEACNCCYFRCWCGLFDSILLALFFYDVQP